MRGAQIYKLYLVLFIVHFYPASGQSPAADSTLIAKKASAAYKLFLTDPDSCVHLAEQSLMEAQRGKHIYLEGYSYYVLSKAYWARGNYRLSIEYGFKALKIYENSDRIFHWGESYLSLARTFLDLKNLPQARYYLRQAEQLAHQHANNRLLADVFRERSMLMTETNNYDSALILSDLGLKLYQEYQDSVNISILYSRKSKVYFAIGDYKRSRTYNRRAMLLDSLVGNRRGLGICYLQAGQNAYFMSKPDSAIYFLNKSIPLNKSIDNYGILVKIHHLMAAIYVNQGKPLLAVEQLNLSHQYKDSLYNTEKAGQIQEMQSLYELESKNRTIEVLNKENALQEKQVKNQRLVAVLQWIGIFLLAALILVLVRLRIIQNRANHELQSKNHAIELQKEEIQSQAENLQHLNNLKSKLFSVISHDLRGPIASLHALLELLTSKSLSEEEFVLFSGKLKTNLSVTQRTLENLLNWSLSQMEGIKTEPQVVDVKVLAEDACRLMEEVANRKSVSLRNTISDSTHVRVDPNQLQLILRNLIHNAIKFSKTNQQVTVSVDCNHKFCVLSITDSGIGMNPDEINLITGSEHFTKVGTQQEKGTGLGLLLCKEFIKRNGGTLEIESTEGEGTEVRISLPIA
jgi:two-component system, sensor histidine kinase and response regulator